MKCQRENCDKVATFHITELTTGGSPQELHLCEECAREYLAQSEGDGPEAGSVGGGMLGQNLEVGKTAEELIKLDKRSCPICGITFYEFRSQGRLGCPHDYVCFEKELEPLIVNIHGETTHVGKRPQTPGGTDQQTELIRLRRDLKAAVDEENYERASELRDEIRGVEGHPKP
ncbi:MAG: UvrB/UvrC motif-containing protein [Pirellulales bacterium]